MESGSYKHLLVEDRGAVRILSVNRPEALNALSGAVIDELIAAVEAIADDAAIRGVVITGAGPKSFVAGADIKEMSEMSPLEAMAFSEKGQAMMLALRSLPFPTLAAVNG
ncbi:MAG: enoyl-CoA hydratase/isomerase family protein, partial [Myxococcales bacterium]|nr:enoyl-CoA hydratase/isomerase family protein [Myxococcales bacterium]